jgi:hypothetical protein
MIPLSIQTAPRSTEQLAAALNASLAQVFNLAAAPASITGAYPSLTAVRIDLNGAAVRHTPPKPDPIGPREPGPTVQSLELSASPLRFERAQLNLMLRGNGLSFDYDRDRAGNTLLVLTNADDGTIEAHIGRSDIELLLRDVAATTLTKEHGVAIQSLEIQLTSAGPRSIAADVRVKAKKLVMSGIVRLAARLDIDDALNATITGLHCAGEGVIGSAVAVPLNKKIQLYNGTRIPLMAFNLGDVKLRDVRIEVTDGLRVQAAFGPE